LQFQRKFWIPVQVYSGCTHFAGLLSSPGMKVGTTVTRKTLPEFTQAHIPYSAMVFLPLYLDPSSKPDKFLSPRIFRVQSQTIMI
jgi:hypothetical protein